LHYLETFCSYWFSGIVRRALSACDGLRSWPLFPWPPSKLNDDFMLHLSLNLFRYQLFSLYFQRCHSVLCSDFAYFGEIDVAFTILNLWLCWSFSCLWTCCSQVEVLSFYFWPSSVQIKFLSKFDSGRIFRSDFHSQLPQYFACFYFSWLQCTGWTFGRIDWCGGFLCSGPESCRWLGVSRSSCCISWCSCSFDFR
jgi:hypothetical protein